MKIQDSRLGIQIQGTCRSNRLGVDFTCLACGARAVSVAPGEGAAEPGAVFPIRSTSVRSKRFLPKRTGGACFTRSGQSRARHTTFRFAPRGATDTTRTPHAETQPNRNSLINPTASKI